MMPADMLQTLIEMVRATDAGDVANYLARAIRHVASENPDYRRADGSFGRHPAMCVNLAIDIERAETDYRETLAR